MTTQSEAAAAAGPAQSDVAVAVDPYAGGPDTVARATDTPGELQPYTELGLRDDEYERIRQILGRRPTQSELAMYSIMWSEHCSYKSSKVHLRQFSEKAPPSELMLAGIGENAGVIRVSDSLAVTFKVESHNHPSFVEPYQGAATGVGGIVRDILAMGARPVAVMDPLRFGAADHPDTARVLPGVVAGVGGYGNCLGLPNIGGEVVFDPCYQGNPLVNALCLGVLPVDRLQNKAAAGAGNVVVLMGAKTGRDGIGGVSVLASATFDDASQQRRPSVQVGDPFMEKLLIESCLELYDAGLVVGIQDLGGAGLTCALTETAAAAGTGMRVWLERVPLREPSMEPHEILASESQERMLLIVEPAKLDAVLAIADKWGVIATAIGEVTPPEPDGQPGRLTITWRDHVVVDVPPGSLADDGPVYARPMREPADLILLQADRAETLPRPGTPDELRETLLRMISSPNLCDRTWVTEQYDRYVLGNTVLAQPEDAGVVRIDDATGLGVALSVDGNGRYARLDPYHGAKLALAESYRNVAVTGARPVAVTNCLNFGSPEDPTVMWQFAEAVRGLADGCAELGIPVTGGNVSFYNQTGAAAIHPTPVVGVLGVLDDVAQRVPMGFVPPSHADGDLIMLLGETNLELSGSEWAWVTHQHLGGTPPKVDLAREQALGTVLAEAARVGHITSAHDLSDGGLAQALVEACLRRGIGARVALPPEFADGSMPFVFLFSESAGRAMVAVPRGHEKAFAALCVEHGLPWTMIGVTDPGARLLEVRDQFTVGLDELRAAYTGTLPALFSGVGPGNNLPADPQDPDASNPLDGTAVAVDSPVETTGAAAATTDVDPEPAEVAPADAAVADDTVPVDDEPADDEPADDAVTESAATTDAAADAASEPVAESADPEPTSVAVDEPVEPSADEPVADEPAADGKSTDKS
ncbi:phosphoribosylformylglycinamidine synthase subunit PurL [Solwaraspora sp. WMMA2056]|uniref:phosphoribosylformylglycinamidine synthase subunit PurL n=1 Tax=Solwaraspora sp. WMMA2056 TaxID=3015161 RepID=UPI00259AEFC0|nr:phosphoribosylformylglycinamidine synthase subunit PurL [Solwaraspora sp. WMMA2056]WJK41536.1 phosphoribosylformylglycinamidine synthase subunit PurL [Solwaraspora sp. WMMA2056]